MHTAMLATTTRPLETMRLVTPPRPRQTTPATTQLSTMRPPCMSSSKRSRRSSLRQELLTRGSTRKDLLEGNLASSTSRNSHLSRSSCITVMFARSVVLVPRYNMISTFLASMDVQQAEEKTFVNVWKYLP